jgi:ABC-type multidrug transport system ATPase subunit
VIIEHVTRRFADVTAVADLSLEVAEGTMLGLIGPSRSGKTTTLRLLTGALAFVGLALFVLTALLLRRSMARA